MVHNFFFFTVDDNLHNCRFLGIDYCTDSQRKMERILTAGIFPGNFKPWLKKLNMTNLGVVYHIHHRTLLKYINT